MSWARMVAREIFQRKLYTKNNLDAENYHIFLARQAKFLFFSKLLIINSIFQMLYFELNEDFFSC
jgi:hypothetical protein